MTESATRLKAEAGMPGAGVSGLMPRPEFVRSGELEIAVYVWGESEDRNDGSKPTIVLMHGYPDSAAVWRGVAERLAGDYRVVSYDVRGAGHSGVPATTQGYAMRHLMADLGAVLDGISPDRPVHLAGHDWGSIAGWEAATTEPLQSRLLSYTTISGPSIDHVGYWIRRRVKLRTRAAWAQVARQVGSSWYMAMFQLPLIAPMAWKNGLDRRWQAMMARKDGTQLPHDEHLVKDGVNGVGLYRANIFQRLRRPQERYAKIPIQLIVPTRDPFVSIALHEDLSMWAPKLWRRELDAGHWAQISDPETIAAQIGEFASFIESGVETPALQAAKISS